MSEQSSIAHLAKNWRSTLKDRLPTIIPKRLFPRALIIVAAPLVLLQSILVFVSMERHWQTVTARLSGATARNIAALVEIYKQNPNNPETRTLMKVTASKMEMGIDFLPGAELPSERPKRLFDILDNVLGDMLQEYIKLPYWIDTVGAGKNVEIRVKFENEVLSAIVPRSSTYASNTHIFIVWMVGSSIILLLIAVMFLRNQIRPILQLAEAADRFGKGLPTPKGFHPHGALEIRQASHAFLRMRDRIERHVDQRTTMLAGVSHDLRTILTRFKLELALTQDSPEIAAMRKDVDEMQGMINAYMDFAKGEGDEETSLTNIDELLIDIRDEMVRTDNDVTLTTNSGGLDLPLRRAAFKRALTNLVSNATQYAGKVVLTTEKEDGYFLIHVDDDGPGIPPEHRKEVFQPFYRLEDARTQYEGTNTGLGLSIARDIVHSHGGSIILNDSPLGGLRATVQIPL